MHELFNIAGNTETRITPLLGSITRRSNINELGEQLDFEIAFNDDRYFPHNPVCLGNIIILRNTNELFRGIVVTQSQNCSSPISYNCFDYAFYLNKSKGIYQFNGTKGKEALETILNGFKVPIGTIEPLGIVIKKIYAGDVISDIIKDILDLAAKESGQKYRLEMRAGKLYIEKQNNEIIKATFKLANNLAEHDVTTAISNPTRKRSIENMRNSIKVTGNDKVAAESSNAEMIRQYGLLQEISSIDGKDIAQAKNIAQNMLKDLGKIFEENSIEVPGDDRVRAGRIIEIQEIVTGMSGKYTIRDVTHTIRNGIHVMSLGLGVL